MRVVFHLGVHHTDEGRLVRTLLRNRDALARHGIAVPGPGRYRKVLRDVVNRLRGAAASAEAEILLTEAILDAPAPETLLLSNESFICLPDRALDESRLYARAFKTAWLRQVFPRHEVAFALALRNPATLVPALFRNRRTTSLEFEDYMTGINPHDLRWSDTVATIREANPDAEIVVWCNEDSPILWGGIMRAVTGLPHDVALDGGLDLAMQIVDKTGAAEMAAHFGRPPHFDGPEVRRRISRLIEAHGRAEEIDEVIDLPGWGEELMGALTAAYDADVARVAAMPGVRLVEP